MINHPNRSKQPRDGRFELVLDLGNAAFGDNPDREIARLLRCVADNIEETAGTWEGDRRRVLAPFGADVGFYRLSGTRP